MKTKFKKLIVVTMLFCGCCSAVLSQAIVEFETITEALNWADTTDIENSKAVKKLVITGNISGEDYSESSEWSKFRTLDETFPNIEAVEILTDQDIPDADIINHCALFYWEEYDDDGIYIGNSGSNWLKSFSAPNVKKIGSWAFRDCKELLSVSFLSAEIIERWTFGYCWKLISIDFPVVTTIKEYSFYVCKGLTSIDSINFPSAITIEDWAFSFCHNLYSIYFPLVTTIGRYAFSFYEKGNSILSVSFPSATIIGGYAFYRCSTLTSANFPLVTTIGSDAFSSCDTLTSVNFPLVTTIRYYAFSYCKNLVSINFPLVTTIDHNTFNGCVALISATFGTSFETETEIKFGVGVFGGPNVQWNGPILTPNIDLTLGKYVLPTPNTIANIWQNTNDSIHNIDYLWKSIAIETVGIEEIIKNNTVSIFPNSTVGNATVTFELEKSCNVKILLCDILGIEQINIYDGFANEGFFTEIIDIEHLAKGVYFLKILIDGNYTVKKIIIN